MKKLLLLPLAIFPYSSVLGVLLSEIFTEDAAPVVFGVFTLAFALASPVCNVIFMFLSRNDDPNDRFYLRYLCGAYDIYDASPYHHARSV